MHTIETSPEYKALIQSAGQRLKGHERRAFLAEVAEKLCSGSPRQTETQFGFSRHTVRLGLHERRTGLICYGNYVEHGKQKTEVAKPQLAADIRSLVDPESQADKQLRNTFAYTRLTASAVRQKLITEKGWKDEALPKVRALSDILNRLGYKLKAVQKTRPEKKSRKPMPFLPTSDQ